MKEDSLSFSLTYEERKKKSRERQKATSCHKKAEQKLYEGVRLPAFESILPSLTS